MTATTLFRLANEPEDRITEAVRKGLAPTSLNAVALALNVSSTLLAKKLNITLRTIDRARKAGRRLDSEMSEKIMRLARVHNIASKIFADNEAITEWMKSPAPALKGEAPLDLLDTDSGCRRVEGLLVGLAHGHFM